MLKPFVNLTPELAHAMQTSTLVTANERLAREYRRAYDLWQNDGREGTVRAWRSPAIFSLSRFLQHEYVRLLDERDDTPALLAGPALILLAQRSRPAELAASALSANDFLSTWQLCQQYDMRPQDFRQFSQSDLFAQWCGAFERLLGDAITSDQIGDLLVARQLCPQHALLFAGLQQLSRPQQRYLEFLASRPTGIKRVSFSGQVEAAATVAEPSPPAAEAIVADGSLVASRNLKEEIAQAALWARQIRASDADATIGIVVPSLARDRAMVSATLGAYLDPHNGSDSPLFDLGAGQPLHAQPVWQTAEVLLRSVFRAGPYQQYQRLAHSAFLRWPQWAPRLQPWPRSVGDFVDLPTLLAARVTATGQIDWQDRYVPRPYRAWLAWFSQLLDAFGWPNLSDVHSHQYQAFQVLNGHLRNAPDLPGRMDGLTALNCLNLCLANEVFAPQRSAANLLVLGSLETTGLCFQHLWVCGADEHQLPAPHARWPLLPPQAARQAGVPRSDQAAELQFTRQMLASWRMQAADLRFSYSAQQDDAEVLPSPLLTHLHRQQHIPPPAASRQTQTMPLESYDDKLGPPLPAGQHSGGTRLLQLQAQCPFRAYAEVRLGLSQPLPPTGFLNAAHRGTLAHSALQTLLPVGTQQRDLPDISRQTIYQCVDTALHSLEHPLPELFVAHERERLADLMETWLVVEQQRQAFTIVAVEAAFEISLDGLVIRLRVDRIDRLNDAWLIIDYKTGAASSKGILADDVHDTQLPCYAQVDASVAGVAYASLAAPAKLDSVVASNSGFSADATTVVDDWASQVQTWQQQLSQLASAFRAGQASVTPAADACQYCHLQAVCRINSDAQS